tara:strand:- start:290 stop:847 length:558 start_codon:yes stop_codon:yes gene_type:complete
MKVPKLELIVSKDGYRPALKYILVTKEKVMATEAHILVQFDTSIFFSESFIEGIPKEGFYLQPQDWKMIRESQTDIFTSLPVSWHSENIILVGLGSDARVVKTLSIELTGKPVDFIAVWNKVNKEKTDSFIVDTKFLNLLHRCLGVGSVGSRTFELNNEGHYLKVKASAGYSADQYGVLIATCLV